MDNKKKKQNQIIKITALLGLFLLVFGVSYALFSVVLEGTKKNKISTGTLDLELINESQEGINLENAVPMGTKETMEGTNPYTFTIKNTGTLPVTYELFFEADPESDLNSKYVKFELERNRSKHFTEFLSYSNLTIFYEEDSPLYEKVENAKELVYHWLSNSLSYVNTKTEDGKTLYYLDKVTIGPNQSYDYSLRMWLAYNTKDTEAMGKNLTGKVKVEGIQQSKDDAYVVNQISVLDSDGDFCQMFNIDSISCDGLALMSRYSDGSIRFSGKGSITKYADETSTIGLIAYDNEEEINAINEKLKEKGYEEQFEDYVDLMFYCYSVGEENIPWDEETLNFVYEKASIIEERINGELTLENSTLNGKFYFEDTVVEIPDHLFYVDDLVKEVYISENVRDVSSSSLSDNSELEKVVFTELDKTIYKTIYKDANNSGLNISSAFQNNPKLTYVKLPKTLTGINDDAFLNSPLVEVDILAKKSAVKIYGTGTLQSVKSVNWING